MITVEHQRETPRWKWNPPVSVALWQPEVAKTALTFKKSRPQYLHNEDG